MDTLQVNGDSTTKSLLLRISVKFNIPREHGNDNILIVADSKVNTIKQLSHEAKEDKKKRLPRKVGAVISSCVTVQYCTVGIILSSSTDVGSFQ